MIIKIKLLFIWKFGWMNNVWINYISYLINNIEKNNKRILWNIVC